MIPAPPGRQATTEARAALSLLDRVFPPCQCVDAIDGNFTNRHGETLWISPHCLGSPTLTLFDAPEAS